MPCPLESLMISSLSRKADKTRCSSRKKRFFLFFFFLVQRPIPPKFLSEHLNFEETPFIIIEYLQNSVTGHSKLASLNSPVMHWSKFGNFLDSVRIISFLRFIGLFTLRVIGCFPAHKTISLSYLSHVTYPFIAMASDPLNIKYFRMFVINQYILIYIILISGFNLTHSVSSPEGNLITAKPSGHFRALIFRDPLLATTLNFSSLFTLHWMLFSGNSIQRKSFNYRLCVTTLKLMSTAQFTVLGSKFLFFFHLYAP